MADLEAVIAASRAEWNRQVNRSRRRAAEWKAMALVFSAVSVILVSYALEHVHAPQFVPVVVKVGEAPSLNGSGAVGESTPLPLTHAAAEHFLRRFVTDVRTVTTDPVALKTQLRDAYTIATLKAQAHITRFIATSDPFGAAKRRTHVAVGFVSFVPEEKSERTWNVAWIEQTWIGGKLEGERSMEGEFNYTRQPLRTDAEAEDNPFGLYVDRFSIVARGAK